MNQETKMHEEMQKQILDSGNRRQFAGGGVRDMAEGKGACYLMPLDVVADVYKTYNCDRATTDFSFDTSIILNNINTYIRTGDTKGIIYDIIMFSLFQFKGLETAMLEVAVHYEMGAKKYAARNWEKILETDCFVDSATRHFFKWLRGDQDEPHDRAFLWNLLGLLWTDKQLAKPAPLIVEAVDE